MTLEVLSEMPEGKIFIIPVKLDECEAPPSLSRLHWISLSESEGLDRLQRAIDSAIGRPSSTPAKSISRSVSPWHEFMEDVIAKGGLIHVDPWTTGYSKEELEFKSILKRRFKTSVDLFSSPDWRGILELWQPLLSNPFFRVDHTEWQNKPYFRCQIHAAKCHLFYAHVQLGQTAEYKKHVPKAFSLLQEVLLGNPYSLKGGSHDRLSTDDARTQNLNYRDTLNFALEWYNSWEGCFDIVGISDGDVQAAKSKIYNRLGEIEFMLQRDPDESTEA